MVENGLVRFARADHFGHRAKLGPGAGVEHHQYFARFQVARLDVDAECLQLAVRIDERQVRRGLLGIDDQHLLAQRLEHAGHSQLAAQGVAVRPDVAGQQKAIVRLDELGETLPGYRHRGQVPAGFVKLYCLTVRVELIEGLARRHDIAVQLPPERFDVFESLDAAQPP